MRLCFYALGHFMTVSIAVKMHSWLHMAGEWDVWIYFYGAGFCWWFSLKKWFVEKINSHFGSVKISHFRVSVESAPFLVSKKNIPRQKTHLDKKHVCPIMCANTPLQKSENQEKIIVKNVNGIFLFKLWKIFRQVALSRTSFDSPLFIYHQQNESLEYMNKMIVKQSC